MAKHATYTKDLLVGLLGVGGTVVVATVAPGMLMALLPFFKQEGCDRKKFVSSLRYAKSVNLILLKESGGATTITLSKQGRRRVLSYQAEEMTIPRLPRWDGTWRLVIFDIPRRYNKGRDALRSKLRVLGFSKLQESVWIHPYPCANEVEFLTNLYGVTPFVKLLSVTSLPKEDEIQLFKRYDLSKSAE